MLDWLFGGLIANADEQKLPEAFGWEKNGYTALNLSTPGLNNRAADTNAAGMRLVRLAAIDRGVWRRMVTPHLDTLHLSQESAGMNNTSSSTPPAHVPPPPLQYYDTTTARSLN